MALGWALYGLWVVFLVIAGRAKVTTRNFPAALAGLVVNVVLLRRAGAAARDRRRRHRAVRRLRGDARGHVPADPARVRGRRSSGAAWPSSWSWSAAWRPPAICCCPPTASVGLLTRAAVLAGDAAGAARHRVRPPAGAAPGARAARPARRPRPRERRVSRPEVSVVMPFAGDERGRAGRDRRAAGARPARRRRADPGRQLRRRRAAPRRRRGDPGDRGAIARPRPQRRRRAGPRRVDPVPRRRLPRARRPARRLLRRADRRRRGRAGRRGGRRCSSGDTLAARYGSARELPLPAGPPEPPLPPARGGGQPARPAGRVRAGRRLLRGGARGRGHRLQLAPAAGRLAARAAPPALGSSTATGRRCASCAASGADTRPAAPGCPPLRGVRARAGGALGRSGACATGRAPRWAARTAAAGSPARAGGAAVEAGPARARPLPGPRRAAVGGGAGRAGPVQPALGPPARRSRDVVLVADRFPARGDPLVEFVRALERARVEAAARPELPDRDAGPESSRSTTARTTGSPPAPSRCSALAVRHPMRAAGDLLARRPGEPAPVGAGPGRAAARRDRRRARARAGRRRGAGHRPAAGPAGRATARRADAADASPHRRPLGVHAALRPRAVRARWRGRGRRGRADHQPVRLRRRPRARRLRGARAVLPPRASARRARRRASPAKLVEHVPDMLRYRARGPCGRRRPLPVAGRPGGRPLSAAPTGRPSSPPTTCSRASRAPGQARAQRRLYDAVDAVVVHSGYGRDLLVERARRRPGEGPRDPPRRVQAPHRSGRTRPAARRAGRRRARRWSCSSACCARTRGSTCCSRPGGGSTAPSCGSSGGRACRSSRCGPARRPSVRFIPRFVSDAELPAFFRRADVVVLPYSRTERFD